MKETEKKIVEKIEVIINRHSPMDNFEVKENCAKDMYNEFLSYHNTILEGVRKSVKECSDCKAQGVAEMVEVHVNHLLNLQ